MISIIIKYMIKIVIALVSLDGKINLSGPFQISIIYFVGTYKFYIFLLKLVIKMPCPIMISRFFTCTKKDSRCRIIVYIEFISAHHKHAFRNHKQN